MTSSVVSIKRSWIHAAGTVIALVALVVMGSAIQVEKTQFASPQVVTPDSPRAVAQGREWDVRLLSIKRASSVRAPSMWDSSDDSATSYETQGQWILARVEFKARSSTTYAPQAALQDATGKSWRISERLNSGSGESLAPGIPVRLTYLVEVPKDANITHLVIPPRAVNDTQVQIPVRSLLRSSKNEKIRFNVAVPGVEVGS